MQIVTNVTFDKIRQIGVGQGLNSKVWLSNDPQLKCELAVKEIDKRTFWNTNCFAEAQALYATDHPNIVRVQWASEQGNFAYIAMPFYPAGSLAETLSNGPLRLSKLLTMAQEVLLGLGHIHSKRFIHLDIKPSNIFFDRKGHALIADFGQSRKITASGGASAPPLYAITMPPEFLLSGNVAHVSDIHHVGALLYRAINGEEEWQRQVSTYTDDDELETAIKEGKFPDRDQFLPHVPKRLRSAIRKALNVTPGDRFTSAAEFGQELGRIDVSNDWQIQLFPNGDANWSCTPLGCAQLEVSLRSSGKNFAVSVHKRRGSSARKHSEGALWGDFPNRKAALKHLKTVFETL
jgi:serine/threonine protein kinase